MFQLKDIPSSSGVYQFFDVCGQVIYVGKASNLKSRLSYYLRDLSQLDRKTRQLMVHADHLEVLKTNHEVDALLLENQLIKQHAPKYNILLKDDKSYPYLLLSRDQFPRFVTHRGKKKNNAEYFGPYPNINSMKFAYDLLQKIFQLRQCPNAEFRHRTRPCLQYQMKRCTAPCVGYLSQERYQQQVVLLRNFLQGNQHHVVSVLLDKMEVAAKQQQFELAGAYRDQVQSLKKLMPNIAEKTNSLQQNMRLDVICCLVEGHYCGMAVIHLSGGVLLQFKQFVQKLSLGNQSIHEVFNQLLLQYYLDVSYDLSFAKKIYINKVVFIKDGVLQSALQQQWKTPVQLIQRLPKSMTPWMEMAQLNLIDKLKQVGQVKYRYQEGFDQLNKVFDQSIKRVECIDISHHQGRHTIASCVVITEEGLLKRSYRRYVLTGFNGDDYAAIQAAVAKRLSSESQPTPDVLLIDGGEGQLSAALKGCHANLQTNLQKKIQLIGIVKGERRQAKFDRVLIPVITANGFQEVKTLQLDLYAPERLMLQALRDEAHRYAITAHRKKKNQSSMSSTLDHIIGLGVVKKRELLQQFGGLQGVKLASIHDLTKVKGIGVSLAEKIYANLH